MVQAWLPEGQGNVSQEASAAANQHAPLVASAACTRAVPSGCLAAGTPAAPPGQRGQSPRAWAQVPVAVVAAVVAAALAGGGVVGM